MNKEKKKIKILFYTCTARAFRTTLVGHLYDVSQDFSVVLISEVLDPETEKVIKQKKYFPGLEKIIQVDLINNSKFDIFRKKTRKYYKLAKEIFEKEKPDILITSGDSLSLFEIYLNRLGKRYGVKNIAIQATFQIAEARKLSKWLDMVNVYTKFPLIIPFHIKIFLVKCRKYLGHFLYYWIFPLTVGELPFFGKSSHVLKKGNSGLRDADYQFVFSKRDYDIWIKDGISADKLSILLHPLKTETREFFKANFFNEPENTIKLKYILFILPDIEVGFIKKSKFFISRKHRISEWVDICDLVSRVYPDHNILLKPHPNSNPFIVELSNSLSKLDNKKIEIIEGKNPIDKYINIADLIIGLPVSTSTALFTANLQCPQKKIISVNFDGELLGDCYKNFNGIIYAGNVQNFLEFIVRVDKFNLGVEPEKLEKEKKLVLFIKKYVSENN